MSSLGQLFRDAISGDPTARMALHTRVYLLPMVESAIEEATGLPVLIIDHAAIDEHDADAPRWTYVERKVAEAVIGTTEEHQTVVDDAPRLAATQELREALIELVARLDDEIDRLHDALDSTKETS